MFLFSPGNLVYPFTLCPINPHVILSLTLTWKESEIPYFMYNYIFLNGAYTHLFFFYKKKVPCLFLHFPILYLKKKERKKSSPLFPLLILYIYI
jgi:hypothetical protein